MDRIFLYDQHNEWPTQPEAARDIYAELLPETLEGVKRDKMEMRISQQMACTLHLQPATDQYYAPLNETLLKYSRWGELRRVVATCLRWRNKKRGIINPVEIWETEEAIIGLSQSQCYRASLAQLRLNAKVNKDNTLAPLAPFLDKRGLIRLGGRTEAAHLNYNAKYPLLLHQKDPITTTLARFIHLQLEHSGGPRAIITELNKIFWAPKSTMLFRKIAYGCIPCRKRLAKPTKQIMAPTPILQNAIS
jgi:hypothetical protein